MDCMCLGCISVTNTALVEWTKDAEWSLTGWQEKSAWHVAIEDDDK